MEYKKILKTYKNKKDYLDRLRNLAKLAYNFKKKKNKKYIN